MQKLFFLLFVLFCLPLNAQSNESRFILSGYGESVYSYFDYGPDQRSGVNGSPPDSRAIVDLPRVVTKMKYYFDPSMYVELEIEYEHGGTGGALELEFEEFGEFEQEVEKGGEIIIPEFYLKKTFTKQFALRAGHFVIPIGILNRYHKPNDYLTVQRSESETSLLPTSWNETGVSISGSWRTFGYQVGLVNGLDGTGFSSKFWIRDGYQGRFEQIDATDLAYYAHVNYQPMEQLELAGSVYRGNTTGNRPKDDMEGISANITITEAHLRWRSERFVLSGQYLYGNLQNSDVVTRFNGLLSNNLGVARTPLAKNALIPFIRYEYYNSMEDVEGVVFADPRFERNVFTGGINFMPHSNAIVKAEYSHRTLGDDRFNDENTFSLGMQVQGTFLNLLSGN